MIGSRISHYKIIEKLGEGGMGVVYKAQDLKLDRIVALKFLPQHLHANEGEQARFLQEAKAASSLNHPNICTIHAIEEDDKKQFIDMELIDGVTLRQKLPIRKLSDALAYGIQIGEALQEAHNKGIVHRDIKADNIMVNAKNQIKVMDFGLAKLKGSLKLTRTSSTVGTVAYMAPEQIQGGDVDARSDIFSFGVVLFEMLTGKLPFRGEHEAAIMYSILNESPESLTKLQSDASPEIERIINRALERDPEDRYQSAADIVSELRRVQKQSSRVSRPSMAEIPVPTRSEDGGSSSVSRGYRGAQQSTRLLVPMGVTVLILVAIAMSYFAFFGKHQSIDSIAVLPFTNVGADPNTEYLSDGITESLINGMSQLSNLTVMSRSSVFHYKGKDVDPQKAGKELGVKAILTGSVTQRGDNLAISAELVDVANNSHIWGEQYNEKLSDILTIQKDISKEISEKLSLKLAGDDQKKLARQPTENTEAYQLYLKGRFHWNKRKADDMHTAVEYFTQAIEKDPNYALAYAGLASAYVLLPEYAGLRPKDVIPKTEEAAIRALALDATLAEPHAVLGLMKSNFEWDWSGAEKEFKRAIELNPMYPTSHHWYSICLREQGKNEQSLAEITRAQELDPLSPVISVNVAEVFEITQRTDQAIDQLKKTFELDPNFPGAHQDLGMIYARQGNYDEAIRELKRVREILGANNPIGIEALGYVYARAGRKDDAVKILEELLTSSKDGKQKPIQIALVYNGLGDKEKVFEWLEKAYDERSPNLGYVNFAPVWSNLRSDPRFETLVKKMGLEK